MLSCKALSLVLRPSQTVRQANCATFDLPPSFFFELSLSDLTCQKDCNLRYLQAADLAGLSFRKLLRMDRWTGLRAEATATVEAFWLRRKDCSGCLWAFLVASMLGSAASKRI